VLLLAWVSLPIQAMLMKKWQLKRHFHVLLINFQGFMKLSLKFFKSASFALVEMAIFRSEKRAQFILQLCYKVENILKGSLDSIPSPSPLVEIQIMGRKVCLSCKGKHCLLTTPSNVLPLHLKQTFPPMI
jgi:hypothetical protein